MKPDKNLMTVFVKIWTQRLPGSQYKKKSYESMEEWLEDVWKFRICAVTLQSIDTFDVWNYAHVLARNFTKTREAEFNIGMLSREAHTEYDDGTREKLLKMGPGAKFWLEYHDKLKSDYYQLKLFNDENDPQQES